MLDKCDTGLIMSADFEAAFDSLSWEFVNLTLNQYGFGIRFRQLVNTLYMNTNTFSRILINGYLGEKIHSNVRQCKGMLFNLAVNLL